MAPPVAGSKATRVAMPHALHDGRISLRFPRKPPPEKKTHDIIFATTAPRTREGFTVAKNHVVEGGGQNQKI